MWAAIALTRDLAALVRGGLSLVEAAIALTKATPPLIKGMPAPTRAIVALAVRGGKRTPRRDVKDRRDTKDIKDTKEELKIGLLPCPCSPLCP
jgi:hypothetical protein